MLNDRVEDILEAIKDYIIKEGYPPSIRDIGCRVHMSTSRVYEYLKILEHEGYIERKEKQPRSIRILK